MTKKVIIGIDLAGKPENPTGWALWTGGTVETSLVHSDSEIIEGLVSNKPVLIAIGAPLALPKQGNFRKADAEMVRKGYRVFPPGLPGMRKLALRAIQINKLIADKGYRTIEVHPTSSRKALGMPLKDWGSVQTTLAIIGLRGNLGAHLLTPHEIDAVLSALTAHLHLRKETEAVGDEEEGYIIIPKERDWRTIKV
jgi:predicted nuclease with RNAse H fold